MILWSLTGTVTQNIDDCILLDTLGSNYAGQSGLSLSGASNKTLNRFMTYAAPSSTQCCAGLSLTSSSTNNTINDSHFYGATANNKVAGMDLWDEGHISPIMLALDLSAVPEQTRVAVWSDNDTYNTGEKGSDLSVIKRVVKFIRNLNA